MTRSHTKRNLFGRRRLAAPGEAIGAIISKPFAPGDLGGGGQLVARRQRLQLSREDGEHALRELHSVAQRAHLPDLPK